MQGTAKRTTQDAQTVTKAEAARMLGVHRNTVGNWLHAGDLHENAAGRIPIHEIERVARDWQPVPELDVVNAAGDAVKYLAGWYDANLLTATSQVIHACKLVAESFADLKQRKDAHAANVVLGERLETFNRLVADVAEAVAHLEGIKALRSVVVNAQGDASRLAREWDKRTHAARQQIKRRIASTK